MSEERIFSITKITVKGFKSIAEECEIDIRPLTILAGVNSSGKSSIMQPLLLLKQTLEAPYDPGPLLIDGPNVHFTLANQFFSKLTDGKEVTDRFHIQIETRESDFIHCVRTTFKKSASGIEIAEMMTEGKYDPKKSWLLSSEPLTLYPEMPPEDFMELAQRNPTFKTYNIVGRSRCFLRLESQGGSGFFNVVSLLDVNIVDIIHLPGLRGNPERTYGLTSTGPRYPGTFENYVTSIIHEWQETKDKRLKTLTDALHTLGITGKVGTERINDARIELHVSRLTHDSTDGADMVSIADVGLGISQVLPVLVAVIAAKKGQLVYIEQPELHLHPRAQVALAQVLADAAKRGVRVVAETHSSLLLLAIQTLVAEGKLSPDLAKLHWFTRRENGVTEVNSADLDEAGAYGEWPEDFDDVDLKAQSRYLNAVDRLRFGKEEAS